MSSGERQGLLHLTLSTIQNEQVCNIKVIIEVLADDHQGLGTRSLKLN